MLLQVPTVPATLPTDADGQHAGPVHVVLDVDSPRGHTAEVITLPETYRTGDAHLDSFHQVVPDHVLDHLRRWLAEPGATEPDEVGRVVSREWSDLRHGANPRRDSARKSAVDRFSQSGGQRGAIERVDVTPRPQLLDGARVADEVFVLGE